VVLAYSQISTQPKDVPDHWISFKEGEQRRIKQTIYQFAGFAAKLSAVEQRLIHGAKDDG
jgi:hypothetical protein